VALRDCTGKYLTAVGRDAVIQARNSTVGKDELFVIEEGRPQVVIYAHNGKMVSIRQGIINRKNTVVSAVYMCTCRVVQKSENRSRFCL